MRAKCLLLLILSIILPYDSLRAYDHLNMLKNGSWEQRITAMYTLGYSGNKKAFWYMVKYLNQTFDSDDNSLGVRVRQAAAISLGRLKDERAIPYLVERYSKETNSDVKSAILFAFRFFKPHSSTVPIIKQALLDPNKTIQWEALMVASVYCDPAFQNEIIQLSKTNDPEINVITAYILYMLNYNQKDNEAIMRSSLTHSNPLVRFWACNFLAKSVGTKALDDIIKASEIESVWWVANKMEDDIYHLARKKFNEEMVAQFGSLRFVIDKKEKQKEY